MAKQLNKNRSSQKQLHGLKIQWKIETTQSANLIKKTRITPAQMGDDVFKKANNLNCTK
jgi:hypothetical protein